MESREILIACTRNQKRYKITTGATTVGELKAALRDNEGVLVKNGNEWVANSEPVDFEGMSFTEGITNTQLLGDESQLPHNVQYKGKITNNLVIVLTNTVKNIASGEGSRKEAYEIIKQNELQEGIEEEYGYNYTNVSTADLWSYIHAQENPSLEGTDEEDDIEEGDYDEEEDDASVLADLVYDYVKGLVWNHLIDLPALQGLVERIDELASILHEEQEQEEQEETFDIGRIEALDKDINDMMK